MITPSVVQYRISHPSIDNFSTVTDNLEEAKRIEKNLEMSAKVIEVLEFYGAAAKERRYETSDTVLSEKQEYIFNVGGLLSGIKNTIYRKRIDLYEGRAPLQDNNVIETVGKEFKEKIVEPIIKIVRKALEQLESISEDKPQFSLIPDSIFTHVNAEIQKAERDLEILRDYCSTL